MLCKKDQAFRSFPDLIELQVDNGAEMGDFCRSPRTAINMAIAISEVMHQDLVQSILMADADLSMIVDGSTGTDGTHYVSVIFQFVGKYLYFLKRVESKVVRLYLHEKDKLNSENGGKKPRLTGAY